MIVYYKLANILAERKMNWKDLCKAGIGANVPQNFSHNKNTNTETINKVCRFLDVQPGDIMEYIPDDEEHTAEMKAQIDALQKELQAKIDALQKQIGKKEVNLNHD